MYYLLVTLLLSLLSTHSLAVTATNVALEAKTIRVEYIQSSNRGIIYVHGCRQCKQRQYSFSGQPEIKRKGKQLPFSTFLKDYWNAKYPTLIVHPTNQAVQRVVY